MQSVSKYYNKIESSFGLTIVVALGITAIFYLILIFKFPGLFADDYYFFYRLQANPAQIISLDINEKFFLFYRPVHYFYFWLLVNSFGCNVFLLKINSVLVSTFYVIIILLIGRSLLNLFYKRSSNTILLLTSLLIAFHHDTVFSVIWLSNFNENLMCLFYSLSILTVLLFVDDTLKSKKTVFILVLTCYTLSILTKQQSLHLPLLIMFSTFVFRKYLGKEKASFLLMMSFFLTLVMIAVAIPSINLFLHNDRSINEIQFYGKKVFAFYGNIFVILMPYGGTEVYNYILQNKALVIVPTVFLVIGIYYSVQIRRLPKRNLLFMFIGVLIVFIPRISLPTSDRINTLYVFVIWMAIMISLFERRKVFYSLYIVLMVNSIMSAFWVVEKLDAQTSIRNELNAGLSEIEKYDKRRKFIVSETVTIDNSSYYYYKNNTFGMDTTILTSAIICRSVEPILPGILEHKIRGDTLTVTCHSDDRYLEVKSEFQAFVISTIPSKIRNYSQVSLIIPQKYISDQVMLLYYSGKKWVELR